LTIRLQRISLPIVPETDAIFDARRERLVGHKFPGGEFRVQPHERWLSHDAMLNPDIPEPILHPSWILIGGLRGMGISIDDLIRLADSEPEAGVVFGETELEQFEPLVADQRYLVSGEITDMRRRVSQRAGVIDLVDFRLDIRNEAGGLVATHVETFVFPRGEAE
jgi:hypothetical protein